MAGRRAAFPAIEARGSILLEDVGASVPQLPQLLSGIAAVAERYAVEIPVARMPAMEHSSDHRLRSRRSERREIAPTSPSTRSCS